MNKALATGAALALALALGGAAAQPNEPTYNISGVWTSSGGGVAQIFQLNKNVSMIFVTPDFAHRYEGKYHPQTPTTVTGTLTRVTRATGCTTRMTLTYTVVSTDLIEVNATALDSNCDLVKNQTFFDINYRSY